MKPFFLLLLLSPILLADTVIFHDDTSLNGTVEFNGEEFRITGRFVTNVAQGALETKTIDVPPQRVKLVRLNRRTDNSGPAPLGEGRKRAAVPEIQCQVVTTQSAKPVSGVLDAIEAGKVVVSGRKLNKGDVVSIRFLNE